MTRFPFPPLRPVAFLSPVSGPSSECANISCCRWKAAQTSDLGADVPRAPSRPPMLWPRACGPSSQGKPPGPLLESGDQRELGVPCSQEDGAAEQWGCGGTEARGGLQATSLSSAWRYFRPQETLDVFGAGPCFHAGQIRTPSRRVRGHISFLGHPGSSPVLLTWSRHQAPTGPQPGSQVGILKCVEPEAVPICTPTVLGSSDHPHPTMADLQPGKPGRPPCVHQPPPQGASPFSASLFSSAWLGLLLSAARGLTLFPSGGGSPPLSPRPRRMSVAVRVAPRRHQQKEG